MSFDIAPKIGTLSSSDLPEQPQVDRDTHYRMAIEREQRVIDCLSQFRDQLLGTDPGHPAITALGQTISRSESLQRDLTAIRQDSFGFGRS